MAKRSVTKTKPKPAKARRSTELEVAKSVGGPLRQVTDSLDIQGMGTTTFGPGAPMAPHDGYSREPRGHDFLTGYNIAARPRSHERVSFDTLKGLVAAYDFAQICIWHRIDSVRSLDWNLTALPGFGGDAEAAIEFGRRILKKPDRKLRFKSWLAKYLFDVLAYDAGCLYRMRNNAGRVIGLKHVDGTTLAPLIDDWGDQPDAPAPGWVQFVQGVPWNWLTEDDLIYVPFRPATDSPYGKSPLESILLNANLDLRFQTYFLSRFTAGNVPEAFAGAPEGWNPQQIEDFQAAWDAMLYGDPDVKHQIKWVPHGTTFAWSNEKDFNDTFSLFLMRKTCAAYHVTPADVGFTEDVNRASGETQADVQFRIGDLPLIQHVQDMLSESLQDDFGLPLEFNFDTGQETEDRLATAQADEVYMQSGVISPSEVRSRVYGLEDPPDQVIGRYIYTARAGPIPVSALKAVQGLIDPETALPLPGAPLPHKPFSPVEGVAPQKPPDALPLAVVNYPAENAASVAADAVADNAAVLKEITAGLTAETGAYGNPLLGPDDDDDDEHPGESDLGDQVAKDSAADEADSGEVAELGNAGIDVEHLEENDDNRIHRDLTEANGGEQVAKEAGAFLRFVKARRQAGKWRPFTFTTLPPVLAHRLNDRGRALIRKDTGQLVAAGLAVVAADTGRVLMLQRAFDPSDPASGTWEMPGGHIEDGETPLDAAWREWQEETGCSLAPYLDLAVPHAFENGQTWTSADGIYQGFVIIVPSETSLPINLATGRVLNPDDPDGDCIETVAWWDPAQLAGNPAVRAELGQDAEVVVAALQGEVVVKAGPKGRWREAGNLPVHAFDLRLTDHYAAELAQGLRAAFPDRAVRTAAAAADRTVRKDASSARDAMAAAARDALPAASTAQLEETLRRLIADSYTAGLHTAAGASGGYVTSAVGQVAAGIDWSTWTPGDPGAALQAADGGLADLLDGAGVTIGGVEGSALDRLGNAIADGLTAGSSVDQVAGSLGDVGFWGDQAELIATTETARCMDAATMDTYGANGIDQFEVLLADGACEECVAVADDNPYPVDDGSLVPIHPRCRCASSPVMVDPGTAPDDSGGDG
jgi:8-oxo-dGTP pyrophosphatase MutT (NUDIX family)